VLIICTGIILVVVLFFIELFFIEVINAETKEYEKSANEADYIFWIREVKNGENRGE